MKLFLTSSGLSKENTEKRFQVAYIPTATNGELGKRISEMPEEDHPLWLQNDFKSLRSLKMDIHYVNLEDLQEENVVAAFADADIIYVQGGNTFYLTHYANTSGFKKHINEIIKDKIYFGISAGSIVAGPDISIAGWGNADSNNVGLTNTSGLAITTFCILPHWNGQIPKEVTNYPFEVKYIKDGEAIVLGNS